MKIMFYEWQKVICKKILLVILVLSFAINAFIVYYNQTSKYNNYFLSDSQQYNKLLDEYSGYSSEKALEKVNDKLLAYEILYNFELLATATSNRETKMYNQMLTEYRKNNPQAYSEAEKLNQSGITMNLQEEAFLVDIKEQLEYIKSYPNFIDEMEERAESQSKSGIFSNSSSFSYKNLFKTAADYQHMKGTQLKIGKSNVLLAVSESDFTDLFVIAIIFMLCIYIFSVEKDTGLYNLIRSSKKGRLNTILTKLAVLVLFTAIISFAFIACNFLVNTVLYGADDLNRSIQSVSQFRNCIFQISVGQFYLLFGFGKIVGFIVIAVIFALIFVLVNSSLIKYLFCVGVLVLEYLLYAFIQPQSSLNILKYINLFYFIDGGEFWGRYLNLNVFSNPVTIYPLILFILSIVFVMCIAVTSILFALRKQENKEISIEGIIEKFKVRFLKINGSTSVFVGELFKYFVQNKAVLLLLLLIGFGIFNSLGIAEYVYSNQSDIAYRLYMEELEGEITPEKEQYIKEQIQYFKRLRRKLNSGVSDTMSDAINNILETEGTAFERVEEQYKRLQELEKTDIDAKFIDENLYSDFIFNSQREWNNFAFICIVILMSIPLIFTGEYKNNIITLLRPTKYGKFKLISRKIVIAFISGTVSFICIYLSYFIKFVATFGAKSLDTAICCIAEYEATGKTLTVTGAFVLTTISYFMLSILVVSAVVFFSIYLKNNLIAMVTSSIVVIIPWVILNSNDFVRIGRMFSGQWLLVFVVICVIAFVISAILLTIASMIFTDYRFGKRSES